MLPLHWLQPYLPLTSTIPNGTVEQILPSFEELQKKTWNTLYSSSPSNPTSSNVENYKKNNKKKNEEQFQDKSPKGSVDSPIQHVVDLINHHCAICTLSSCSGRTSLFDPNEKQYSTEEISYDEFEDAVTAAPFTEASGKGRGGWIVVSHEHLDPETVVKTIFSFPSKSDSRPIFNDNLRPWTLKFEPLLLHIAARSLEIGQALLQLALECGFRESGLVVTSKRVTVAIRSHSLALSMPLLPPNCGNTGLCPTPDFVRAMVHECNQRLIQNWNHLERLYRAMEQTWFRISLQPEIRVISRLPPLRLWSATTVAVRDGGGDGKFHTVYAFGGYGRGPEPSSTASSRSSAIYQLRISRKEARVEQKDTLLLSSSWEEVMVQPSTASSDCWRGLAGILPLKNFPVACQGMAAAVIDDWIVLWGGRTSPSRPLDPTALYLFHSSTWQLASLQVKAGQIPEARYGHSFVPLSGNRLALIGGGGCGEVDASTGIVGSPPVLQDAYILHYLGCETGFYWERLEEIKLRGGRMHAAVAGTIHNQSIDVDTTGKPQLSPLDTLLVAGGLRPASTQLNPLLLFSESSSYSLPQDDNHFWWSCRIGATTHLKDGSVHLQTPAFLLPNQMDVKGTQSSPTQLYGATLSTLFGGQMVVLSGGVSTDSKTEVNQEYEDPPTRYREDSIKLFIIEQDGSQRDSSIAPSKVDFSWGQGSDKLDFGSLVHHTSIALSDSEFILVGGGVTSFAFGETFACSYHLEVVLDEEEDGTVTSMKLGQGPTKSMQHEKTSADIPTWTDVVYVHPKDAKRVKTEVQSRGWLDRSVRMTTVNRTSTKDLEETVGNKDCIQKVVAIPVTKEAWTHINSVVPSRETNISTSSAWEDCILDMGQERNMPLSTGRFAAQKN